MQNLVFRVERNLRGETGGTPHLFCDNSTQARHSEVMAALAEINRRLTLEDEAEKQAAM